MNATILNVLCEGPTEEKFVKEVLGPYLKGYDIIVKSRILVTSRKKKALGGLISYQQARNDLSLWMKEVAHRNSETHYFTTMFDLYALPDDFPGMKENLLVHDAYVKIGNIEEAFGLDINNHHFIPYIQLHEFEALLFCEIEKLTIDYPKCQKDILALKEILRTHNDNPELIDSSPQTAPSKWIIKAIEGKRRYNYDKPKSGTTVTKSIGMEYLKHRCRHFNEWISKLKSISKI